MSTWIEQRVEALEKRISDLTQQVRSLTSTELVLAGNGDPNGVVNAVQGTHYWDITNQVEYVNISVAGTPPEGTDWCDLNCGDSGGGVVRLYYDFNTGARGWQVQMVNRTGHASILGELVSCSTTADREAILQANEYDTVGVVAEAGIAQGSAMWVWMVGSICQVLAKDTVAFTRGNILIAADTDGRADNIANPGGGLPGTDTHFKECGHVMENQAGGVNVLVLCILHFN